jgi:hypothetical protein
MLKIEQQTNSSNVSVRLKDKGSLLDRPFKQALIYSFLFHALVFGVFRVQFSTISDPTEPINPVEVAIDTERTADGDDAQELVAIAEQESTQEKVSFAPYVKEYIKIAEKYYSDASTAQIEPTALHESEVFDDEGFEEKLYLTKLPYQLRHYPLRLEFTTALSKLKLLEDGSSLFKEKSASFSRQKIPFAFFTIAYNVKISGQTGKITEWKRKRELLDKKLQVCADRIIDQIQFAPFQLTSLRGKIWIVFECSGDEISEYL